MIRTRIKIICVKITIDIDAKTLLEKIKDCCQIEELNWHYIIQMTTMEGIPYFNG